MVLIAGKCLAMPSEWSHRKSWWWRWRSRTSCIPHTWLIDILMFFVKKMMLLIYVYIFIYNRIHTQLGIVRHWSFSHNSPYPAAFCPCHPCHFVTMTDPPRGATLAVGTFFFIIHVVQHGLPRNFRWSKHVFQHLSSFPRDFLFPTWSKWIFRPQVHCLGWRAVMWGHRAAGVRWKSLQNW